MIWQRVKQHKKWFILLIMVVLIGSGGFFYSKKPKTVVTTGTPIVVGRGDIQQKVSATGTISAVNSVDVSSRVTGLITEVRVKENDNVTAGQILLLLDDSSLRAQVAQYKAQLANYAVNYERSKMLANIGGESLQQLDTDKTNYLVAQSTYDNYASQLDNYVIKAPISGVVIGKPTPAGQTVAQGISTPQVIMTIADMSLMQIKVMVDESDIGKIKTGQSVSFSVVAYTDQVFTGKVTSVSKSATTSSNVVYYSVYVDVDSSQGLLYPTMTARVTINVNEQKNVLTLPLAAVKKDKGQTFVQSMVNGTEQSIPVQIGISDDEKVEIISGVTEGDRVLLPIAKSVTATNKNQGPPPPM